MLQPAFVVPEKRGGFLIHGAQPGVWEVRNTSIHGEGTQVYVNSDVRTADEIAYVVDALRPHSLYRAQSGAIGLMIEPGVEVLAGIDPVGSEEVWLGRTVGLWHGDIASTKRRRILTQRPDILLTTPESLESMLVSTHVDHRDPVRVKLPGVPMIDDSQEAT